MESNLYKLETIVRNSTLGGIERGELMRLFSRANDQELANFVNLATEGRAWINFFYNNQKMKREFLCGKSTFTWQELINEERERLEELL
ncbi:MAG: hypothetical protein V1696_00835 [Candidatus Jorgensenbacteria bacterium]